MITRLWHDEPPPQIPAGLDPKIDKYIRELHDYAQRLGSLLTGYNLREAISQEGKVSFDWVQYVLDSDRDHRGPPDSDWLFDIVWNKAPLTGLVHMDWTIYDVDHAHVHNLCTEAVTDTGFLLTYDGTKITVHHDDHINCPWVTGDIFNAYMVYVRD